MTLHFAYGANMSPAVMAKYAPGAQALGVAALAGHRFVITADGYASVERARGQLVHGVLWRIAPRDRVLLDAWENTAVGLYRAKSLWVRRAGQSVKALVYLARPTGEGRPKPGYMELVISAARQWELHGGYVEVLQRWLQASARGGAVRKIGAFR
jgi:hypothetical protein